MLDRPDPILNHFEGCNRVLVIESEASTPHLETGLEIARRLHDGGLEVHYAVLQYPIGSFNAAPRWPVKFRNIGSGVVTGVRELLPIGIEVIEAGIDVRTFEARIERFPKSFAEIMAFSIDGANLGLGAMSSASHLMKRSRFSDDENLAAGAAFAVASEHAYQFVESHIASRNLDAVVVFNGRFSVSFAARYAAIQAGKTFFSHERASAQSRFRLLRCRTPHDWQGLREAFQVHASGCETCSESSSLQDSMLDSLRRRGFSPASRQLPDRIGQVRAEFVVSYFSSSFAEYAFTEWERFLPWKTEQQAVEALVQAANRVGMTVVLRLHPNMSAHGLDEERRWDRLIASNPEIIVVRPGDDCDSRELMRSSRVVATGFSTIGLEAIMMRIPTIALGDAPYVPAVGDIRARSVSDIVHLLKEPRLADSARAATYCHFQLEDGLDFRHFMPTGTWSGHLDGWELVRGSGRGRDLAAPIGDASRLFERIKKCARRYF